MPIGRGFPARTFSKRLATFTVKNIYYFIVDISSRTSGFSAGGLKRNAVVSNRRDNLERKYRTHCILFRRRLPRSSKVEPAVSHSARLSLEKFQFVQARIDL